VDDAKKTCLGCGLLKSLDEFYNQPKGKYGKRSRCKSCTNTTSREYLEGKIAADPNYLRDYQKAWRSKRLGKGAAQSQGDGDAPVAMVRRRVKLQPRMLICAYPPCGKEFVSARLNAKYCSMKCAGSANWRGLQPKRKIVEPPKAVDFGKRSKQVRPRRLRYPAEVLIGKLVDLARTLGRTPNKREVRLPNESVYRDRFGSWNNAIVAAGLEPNIPLPERYAKAIRENGGESPLRNKARQASFRMRFRILKRDGFRCKYCGGTPDQGYILHVDHVDPKGPTTEENLVTACWICNLGKSNEEL
jgi:hypothetical protein